MSGTGEDASTAGSYGRGEQSVLGGKARETDAVGDAALFEDVRQVPFDRLFTDG